ncbi:unnamed protein product [Danaus chrysippus]|uniref:(African queen) hypothetical protein n=1 Tax=Danaus chrysippus TaxID=151541 RepID=A0A8J2R7P3_9NEOP|nr:unnamed protein product [Danaus chrysippus]
MDQRVQCPVCTLYLHSGMSLETHLDTHPKDQVIKALCCLSKSGSSSSSNTFSSRTPTPLTSERSYRSRSRTPATDDSGRWAATHRNNENERFWRRTPSRTKSTPTSNTSRNATPDLRIGSITFENASNNNSTQCSDSYTVKSDKTPTYGSNAPSSDFDQPYPFFAEQQDDPEIKFSRSSEYSPQIENTSNIFGYNMPIMGSASKIPSANPIASRRGSDYVKIVPKSGNVLLKSYVGGMPYLSPGGKPMHVVLPNTPPFAQKNLQSNLVMPGSLQGSSTMDPKTVTSNSSQYNQLTTDTFTQSSTVVTQNSQIIYREMVHNVDGKPYISNLPSTVGSQENTTNVAQSSSMYQNVMVVDQFGNTSCMYTSPHLLPKTNSSFNENLSYVQNVPEKSVPNVVNDANKTLIIEVSPMLPPDTSSSASVSPSPQRTTPQSAIKKNDREKSESKSDTSGSTKGLKILSNIKVEVPVQHHKNMLNTVMDLTGSTDSDYPEQSVTPEKILPDLDNPSTNDDCTQPSIASVDSIGSNSFSVIKNSSNSSFKESVSKTGSMDNKLDTEFSDSCPVPDLICNEKPSISPCSELSEHGDNSTDRTSPMPKPESSQSVISTNTTDSDKKPPNKTRNNLLRLNNIFVKKHKKVLQIKNAKLFPPNHSQIQETRESSSSNKSPENFSINKIHSENGNTKPGGNLHNISIEKIKAIEEHQNEFDANTEEQSMDIEPVTPSNVNHSHYTTTVDMVHVKEEVNSSNDFSNEERSSTDIAPMETLRPINVINYSNMTGDFDEESNHRELLELEAASKNKQFVSMMNENYFGDNIYADYFTPDRVEAFDAAKESNYVKDNTKDPMYIWGESSQKESEFVLPNFIHESYKIAENGVDYNDLADNQVEVDRCERDSKADVLSEGEPPLNICSDERMPPRGELSGQESNGDMESPWNGMYSGVQPTEPYDLMARESWVSDASDDEGNEKTENIEEEIHFPKMRQYNCAQCSTKFATLKEMRAHRVVAHALPTCSSTKTSYSRLMTARAIKKEEKPDESVLAGNLLTLDSKESMATTMMQVYDSMNETKPQIERLIKTETKKRRRDYVCPTCKEDQLTEAGFHAHLKIHPLECLTCGKCFFKRANLALHAKTHTGIKNFKCEICEKRFLTRQKLTEHHNVHTGRTPVKCTMCDDTFRRYSNMVQHRDRHHFKKKAKVRDFLCHCGAVFHSRAKLHWHKETHEDKPKACLYCSDKFVHAASLTRHVRRTHNEHFSSLRIKGKLENVPCPVCKQMYLRTNLRAHLLTHSGKRPYHCIICNKGFTTKWNLKLHRWTHLSRSAKPYKCTLCKGAFIRQTEYISHMNAHKSVRPYTCNYCGCQFIRKYNCQRHVREHETAKKYVCKVPECGKSFHRSYYLSEHMKVHSGARPFSCNICGKTSSNKSNHNKHVKIHHAREPVATEA